MEISSSDESMDIDEADLASGLNKMTVDFNSHRSHHEKIKRIQKDILRVPC